MTVARIERSFDAETVLNFVRVDVEYRNGVDVSNSELGGDRDLHKQPAGPSLAQHQTHRRGVLGKDRKVHAAHHRRGAERKRKAAAQCVLAKVTRGVNVDAGDRCNVRPTLRQHRFVEQMQKAYSIGEVQYLIRNVPDGENSPLRVDFVREEQQHPQTDAGDERHRREIQHQMAVGTDLIDEPLALLRGDGTVEPPDDLDDGFLGVLPNLNWHSRFSPTNVSSALSPARDRWPGRKRRRDAPNPSIAGASLQFSPAHSTQT